MNQQRVVFDTSTLVSSALRPDSIPHQALVQAFCSSTLCVSKATLEELREVLARDKFSRYLNADARLRYMRLIEGHARPFLVDESDWLAPGVGCRDPKDDKFLALAAACEAGTLVSSDEDLLVLDPWNEIRILRPHDFLNEVNPTMLLPEVI